MANNYMNMWNRFVSQIDPNGSIDPNVLRQRIFEEAKKVNNTLREPIAQAKANINKGLDIIYPNRTQTPSQPYVKGTTGNLKVTNPETIAKALAKKAGETVAQVPKKEVAKNLVKGWKVAGPIGAGIGFIGGFDQPMRNWYAPGSDARTRAIDLIGAIGAGSATGLGTAGGTALGKWLGHPVIGGLAGGGLGALAGGALLNNADKNAEEIRWRNLYSQNPDYDFYNNASLQEIQDRRDRESIDYVQKGIADGVFPATALDDLYTAFARRNAGVSNRDIKRMSDIAKEKDAMAEMGNKPEYQIEALPQITPQMARELQASLYGGNNVPSINYPKENLTGLNGAPISANDLMATKFFNDYFGLNQQPTQQQAGDMPELRGKADVSDIAKAPVPQGSYSPNERIYNEPRENSRPLTADELMLKRLEDLNKLGYAQNRYKEYDPIQRMWIAKAGGMTPYQVWGDYPGQNTRLKNLYGLLNNEYSIRKDMEDRARQEQAREQLAQTFWNDPVLNSMVLSSDNVRDLLPYLGIKEKMTYPFDVAKDERALQNALILGNQKGLFDIDLANVRGQYGLDRQDLVNSGALEKILTKAGTPDINRILSLNTQRDIASANNDLRMKLAKFNAEEKELLAKMQNSKDPNFNAIPNLLYTGLVSEEDAKYMIDIFKQRLNKWEAENKVGGNSVTNLPPIQQSELDEAFRGVQ